MTQTYKNLEDAPKQKCCRTLGGRLDADMFKALCDPNRLAMLVRLAGYSKPATVSQIACCHPVDISVVSRHLKSLKDVGVLIAEKRGKEVFYSVNYKETSARLRAIADAIDACCQPGCCS